MLNVLCDIQQVASSDLPSGLSSVRWSKVPFLGYHAVAVQMKWDGEYEIVLQIRKLGILLSLRSTSVTQTQRQQWFFFFSFLAEKGCIKVLRKSIIQLPELPKDLLMFNLNSPLPTWFIWLFKTKVTQMVKVHSQMSIRKSKSIDERKP